jgi:hypothetical protein
VRDAGANGHAGDAGCESSHPVTYPDRDSARRALTGALREAANRFFRGATSKSTDFFVSALRGGGYRFAFFTPARTPGYGKRYVQEINASGAVVREYKETHGPQGLIEVKWIHGGPQT